MVFAFPTEASTNIPLGQNIVNSLMNIATNGIGIRRLNLHTLSPLRLPGTETEDGPIAFVIWSQAANLRCHCLTPTRFLYNLFHNDIYLHCIP